MTDESSDWQIVEYEFEVVQILDGGFETADIAETDGRLAKFYLVGIALELQVVHGVRHTISIQYFT